MTALLTDNLPLLAGAPNGIKKLRELILELAVRGKLVPQDPSDEPASELLKRIHVEKQRLLVASKARKQKELAADVLSEPPYGVPSGWEWQTLDSVLYVTGGVTLGRKLAGRKLLSKPYLRVANVQRGHLVLDQIKEVEIPEDEVEKYLLLSGDLLITEGGDWDKVGRTAIWRDELPECLHQNHVFRARAVTAEWEPRWAEIYLNSATAREYFAGSSKQTTNLASINMTQLRACAFPLPPLAEQHRIVTKVDELMALCDRLEARQADAASAHARLVQALLDSLTQASDADDFAASWQRLAEHFHSLFTSEASIDALKQALLQLAVMGKLVPQEAEGNEQDELPAGWCTQKIEDFCTVQGGIQKTPLRRPVSQHFPYLRVANVQRGRIDIKELERYELSLDELEKWRLNAGDLLIVEGNGSESEIGRCAIWRGEVTDCVYQNHLMRVRPKVAEQVEYLALYLNSPVGMAHMKRLAITTSGLFNLSVGKIRSIPVALPPLTEQHRIVAKLDQLMTLCDQFKARLTAARQLHERLAGALVEQAVA
ncbi:Type-1 restriction enzyme EcoKI specificity protein [compost metagenome]